MKLSAFTEQTLRTLICLAAEPAQGSTASRIAAACGLPEHQLMQVAHFLRQQGWLRSGGARGSLELALPPERIGLGQVVRAAEGDAVVVECFDGSGDCRIAQSCRLRGVLAEAVAAFEAVLDHYTLADLVRNRRQLAKVLFLAPAAQA